MRPRVAAARNPAALAVVVAGLAVAALGVTGCSGQPDASRASVESCVQSGIAAIKHHVTVASPPPACQGLTGAQIDFAVGTALRSAAADAHGKTRQRELIGKASHYLEHMVVTVPRSNEPQVTAPATRWISTTALGLIALCTWLITVALGLGMMARWILRSSARHAPGSRLRRPPPLNLAHLGLASASLLIWIAYLATGITGLAWTASALLLLVTGLGMTLLFLSPSARPADGAAAQARGDSSRRRRPPVYSTGAHVTVATATILFAFLTAIGAG